MWTRAATWTERAFLALAIVCFAGVLRFAGLDRTIPRHVDEGLHLYETRKLIGVGRAVRQCAAYWRANPATTVPRLDLTPAQRADVERIANEGPDLQYARPLFNLLIAGTATLCGFTPWVGSLTSAVFGTACLLAVFALGRRWWGTGAALVAITFLAASPTHVWYSRTSFADVSAMFWLLCAAWAYASRRPALSGVLFGAAIATNPRSIYQALVLLALEATERERERASNRDSERESIRGSLARVKRFLAGAVVVPLSCEALYHGLLCVGAASGVHLVRKTYFMSFLQLTAHNSRILVGSAGRGNLHAMAAGAEAPAVVALALCGLVLAAFRRPGFAPAAGAWLMALLVPLHFLTHPELRYSIGIVPFMALLAGGAAWWLAGSLPAPLRAPALVALVAAGTLPQLWPDGIPPGVRFPPDHPVSRALVALTPRTGRGEPTPWAESPWPRLRADLGLAGGATVASTGPTVFAADIPWPKLPQYTNTPQDLDTARAMGARRFVVELTHHTSRWLPRTLLVEGLRARGGAVVYDDPLATATRTWADGPSPLAPLSRRAQARAIEVYALDPL